MHALAHQPSTATHGSRWERLAFAGGLAAAVLYLGGVALFGAFVVPQMPPLDAPAAQVARFYAAQSAGGLYPLVSYLGHAELPLLLLFFGGLFGVLRRAEGGSEALAAAVFAGGVVGAVILPIVFVIENHVLLGLAAAGGDALTVRAFDGMGPVSFGLSGFTQAVVVGGTAALLRVEPRVPPWLQWYAIAVVVVSLIGTGTLMVNSLFPIAALATLLYRIWILVLSGVLLRSSTPARTRLVPQ
jgi:hypothetical protein